VPDAGVGAAARPPPESPRGEGPGTIGVVVNSTPGGHAALFTNCLEEVFSETHVQDPK
jgi:hypothetical protein